MNAPTRDIPENEFYASPVGKPFYISLALHVFIFILATVGIPFLAKDIEPPSDEIIMNVEFLDLANVPQAPIQDDPHESEEPLETIEPAAQPKPVYNSSDSVPDLLAPKPVEKPEPPKEEAIPDPTAIKEPPKPQSKPKPPPKPKPAEQKKPDPKPQDQQNAFDNLLRDITPEQEDATQSKSPPNAQKSPQQQSAQTPHVSAQMLASMEQSLNSGIRKCWNVDAGGKDARNQRVELYVTVNRDRTVARVDIVDQLRYSTDKHYQAAADAARRSLLNRACWPLQLPEDKYEIWKSFPYTFDPSGML